MAEKSKTQLKTLFEKGDVLTESSMVDLIDSFVNKKTLGVADPSSSGVSSDIGTIGFDTSGGIWGKIGNGDTDWEQLNGVSGYSQSFADGDLSSSVLSVNHNLDSQFNIVQVYDENNQLIIPDEITSTDANNTDIDLTSFSPITGTWNVVVK